MFRPKFFLIVGGTISALISILHVFLALKPEYYKYIAPGQESALAQMAVQGSNLIVTASIALALIFAIWALYAFSGAGLVSRLPLLGKALIAIGVIYVLRSLFLPSEINMVLTQGYPFRFVVYSTISLVAGLFYLVGFLKQRRSLTPGR